MDRHHRAGLGDGRRSGVEDLLVGRHQARLPVVAVDDVEGRRLAAGQLDRGPREEDEALRVVGVVFGAPVKCLAIKELIVGHEQGGHRRAGQPAAEDPGQRPPRAERHLKLEARRLDRQTLGEGLTVGGKDKRDLAAQPGERLG